jgi:hypothetical protein
MSIGQRRVATSPQDATASERTVAATGHIVQLANACSRRLFTPIANH